LRTTLWIAFGVAGVAISTVIVVGLSRFGSGPDDGGVLGTGRAGSPGGSGVPAPLSPSDRVQQSVGKIAVKPDPSDVADACAMVREQGDYRELRECLLNMSLNERFGFILGEFLRLRSRVGNSHDYTEKIAIIDKFGGEKAADFKNRLLKATGRNLDPVNDRSFIMSLDPDSWRAAVTGAAEENSSKAFELAVSDLGEANQRIACAEVTRIWLGLDSIAASERIASVQTGPMKDAAICELVEWLVRKGGGAEATAWIAEISDLAQREELRERILER
jgi:hypothetical protein